MRNRQDATDRGHGDQVVRATRPHLRVSDAERNEVADRLAQHFTDGRLNDVELRGRLDRAMGATTRGDLDGLFDDLPRLPDEAAPHRRGRTRHAGPVILAVICVLVVAGPIVHAFQSVWIVLVLLAVVMISRSSRTSRRGDQAGLDR